MRFTVNLRFNLQHNKALTLVLEQPQVDAFLMALYSTSEFVGVTDYVGVVRVFRRTDLEFVTIMEERHA